MSAARARVRVPEHVVSRAFGSENVVLNLHTGEYHELSAMSARMFELLRKHGSVPVVADVVANEVGQPVAEVASDLEQLCTDLAWRDLLEIDGAAPGGVS